MCLLEPGVRTGVPLLVDNPKEVGADRVANCLAAQRILSGYAVHRRRLRHVHRRRRGVGQGRVPRRRDRAGGEAGRRRAADRTVTVRRVELRPPRGVLGKNTVEACSPGAVYGFAGQVDGLVDRIRDDVDGFGGDDVRGRRHRSRGPADARRVRDDHRPSRPPHSRRAAAGARAGKSISAVPADRSSVTLSRSVIVIVQRRSALHRHNHAARLGRPITSEPRTWWCGARRRTVPYGMVTT